MKRDDEEQVAKHDDQYDDLDFLDNTESID